MADLLLHFFNETQEAEKTAQEIIYFVQLKNTPAYCPHCGSTASMYMMGQSKTQWIKDAPQGNKRVRLFVYRNRYQCGKCGVQFWERMPDVDPKRKMTKRLVAYIPKEAQRCLVAPTAKKLGICEGTIRQVCRDAMTEDEYKELVQRGIESSGRRKLKR